MNTLDMRAPSGLVGLEAFAGLETLDDRTLMETSGGMAILAAAGCLTGAIGFFFLAGVVVGLAWYVYEQ